MSVAIVIEKSAACAPVDLFVINTGFAGHIREGAIAVVVEQKVVSPKAAEQVVPTVIVVVADADAGLPASAGQTRCFRDIGKCAVPVVLEELRGGCFSFRPFLAQTRTVGEIDVEPAIVVVIEKCNPAALGFDDVALVGVRSPNVWNVKPGLMCDINKLHLLLADRRSLVEQQAALPAPERCG